MNNYRDNPDLIRGRMLRIVDSISELMDEKSSPPSCTDAAVLLGGYADILRLYRQDVKAELEDTPHGLRLFEHSARLAQFLRSGTFPESEEQKKMWIPLRNDVQKAVCHILFTADLV